MKTYSIIVAGKVQGVYYRQSTKHKAQEMALKGTVQNLKNGSVQIIATGEAENLVALVEWCKTGPINARVEEVICSEISLQSFKAFEIL